MAEPVDTPAKPAPAAAAAAPPLTRHQLAERTGAQARNREMVGRTERKGPDKGKMFSVRAKPVEAYQYHPSKLGESPMWVDHPNWGGFDGGPVLRVPNYVEGLEAGNMGSTAAKPGDFIVRVSHEGGPDTYKVVPRDEFLDMYDAKDEVGDGYMDSDKMKKAIRPAQESNAPVSGGPVDKAAAAKVAVAQDIGPDVALAEEVVKDPVAAHAQDATPGVKATGPVAPNVAAPNSAPNAAPRATPRAAPEAPETVVAPVTVVAPER